jgi:hypothetical protein
VGKNRVSSLALAGVLAVLVFSLIPAGSSAPERAHAAGGTFYVAASGSVGNGSSCASPDFVGATGTAIQSAITAASSGNTVHICSGTYSIGTRLEVTKSLTIKGDGASLSTLDGLGTTQIMIIQDNNLTPNSGSEITVNVNSLGFINGYVTTIPGVSGDCTDGSECGGAIYIESESRVNINDSYFKNNYASFIGGAVARLIGDYQTVPATINNSTFESNTAVFDGGAVATLFGFGLTIDSSTFYKNKITSRSAAAVIANFASATINNSTFVDNTGPSGTTVLYGSVTVNKSVIAQSSSSMIKGCQSSVAASGSKGNLVTDNSCSGVISNYPATPATDSAIVNYADLKLGELSYRGYTNKTIPLLSGSVALDFWSGCSGNDQHGFSRPQGTSCDLGAYERPSSQSANALTGWTYASSSLDRANGATASVVTPATNAGSLPVTYASLTTSVCTIDASTGTITLVATGTCNLTATTTGSLLNDQDQLTKSLTIAGVFPPANSAVPLVAGTNRAGLSLTSTNGSWTNSPTSYSYQWMSSATSGGTYANISGATASTYELAASDVGRYIRLSVVANNGSGGGAAALSATRGPVADYLTGVAPELSDPTPTDDGFTVEITNYSNVVSYALENYSTLFSFSASTTGGSVSLSNGIVNVSGLAASESATVTVTASRNGYTSRSASKTGSARVPATTTTTSSTTTTVAPTTTIPATTTTVAETIPAPVVTQGKKPVTTTAPSTGPTTTVVNPMQNEGVTTTTEAVRVKGSAIPGAQGITEPGEDAPLEISPEVQAAADEAVSDIFDEPVTVADLSDAVADLVEAADTPEEVAALVGSLLKQDLSDEQFAAVADNVFADNLSDESFVAALDVVFEEPLSDEQFSSVLESVLDEPLSEGQFDDFVDVLDADTISEEQVSSAIDAILENDISDTEAESLAQSERVLESIDGEQATEIFAAIELDGLTDAEGAEIVDAVQNADDDVRGAFEDELNVFEGQFDEYVALNSKIDVGERRTVVAVSVVSTVAVASIAAAVPPPMGGGAPAVRGAMPMGGGAPVGGGSAELAEAIKTESNRIRRISKYKYLNGRRVVDKKNFSKKLILSIMQNSFTLVGFIVVYLTLSGSVRTIAGLATLVAFFSTLYIDMREED